MGNFSEGFWNIFIVVCTLGGIVWLYLLTAQNMGTRRPAEGGEVETTKHVWDEDLTELNNPLPRWWVMLFYITLAFGVLYLMLYPGLGSNSMFLGWNQIKEYEEEMARAEERYGPIFEQYASPAHRGGGGGPEGAAHRRAAVRELLHGMPRRGRGRRARLPRTCATTSGSGVESPSRSGPASSPAAPG